MRNAIDISANNRTPFKHHPHYSAQILQRRSLMTASMQSSLPIGNMLRCPKTLENADVESLFLAAASMRAKERMFNNAVISVLAPSPSRPQKIMDFLRIPQYEPKNLTSRQLTRLMKALNADEAWDEMIQLYDKATDSFFLHTPPVLELIITAYEKKSEHFINSNSKQDFYLTIALSVYLEKARLLLIELRKTGITAKISGLMGKVYKLLYLYQKKTNDETYIESLKNSVDILKEGYLSTFEQYPGINLMYMLFTLGCETQDETFITQAKNIAHEMEISLMKAGGEYANNFWVYMSLLETQIVTGKGDIDTSLRRVLTINHSQGQKNGALANLTTLQSQLIHRNKSEESDILDRLNSVIEKLTNSSTEDFSAVIPSSTLLNAGFSYGGEGSVLGNGNIPFGGQLHAHIINEWDRQVARQIIQTLGLDMESEWEKFNSSIDTYIRIRMGTERLEDLHGEEHEKYDRFILNLKALLFVSPHLDSRTNVLLDFFLKKGDCRNNGQIKGIFFEAWKEIRIQKNMRKSHEEREKENISESNTFLEEAKKNVCLDVLFSHVELIANVEMYEKYNPKKTADGKFIKSNTPQSIEDHSINILIIRDPENLSVIKKVILIDSFYQTTYKLGGPGGIEIPLENITFHQDGSYEMIVGNIETDQGPVPLTIKSLYYSLDKSKQTMIVDDDDGGVYLRGLPLSSHINIDGSPNIGSFMPAADSHLSTFANKIIESTVLAKTAEQLIKYEHLLSIFYQKVELLPIHVNANGERYKLINANDTSLLPDELFSVSPERWKGFTRNGAKMTPNVIQQLKTTYYKEQPLLRETDDSYILWTPQEGENAYTTISKSDINDTGVYLLWLDTDPAPYRFGNANDTQAERNAKFQEGFQIDKSQSEKKRGWGRYAPTEEPFHILPTPPMQEGVRYYLSGIWGADADTPMQEIYPESILRNKRGSATPDRYAINPDGRNSYLVEPNWIVEKLNS